MLDLKEKKKTEEIRKKFVEAGVKDKKLIDYYLNDEIFMSYARPDSYKWDVLKEMVEDGKKKKRNEKYILMDFNMFMTTD